MQWFDVTGTLDGLNAMQAATDQLYGMPKYGTDPLTGQTVYDVGVTAHYTAPMPHPTQDNRWAMPITDDCVLDVQNIISQAQSRISGGSTDPNDIVIAGLPALISVLDSSWSD